MLAAHVTWVGGHLMLAGTLVGAQELGLEERVRAQEAMDRVYYSHQIGATEPFERAVSRELLSHVGGPAGVTTLVWTAPADPGGSALVYDTVSSLSAADFDVTERSAECLEADGSDTEAQDDVTPASGVVRFFLTRAGNACGDGPAGASSTGEPHSVRDCP